MAWLERDRKNSPFHVVFRYENRRVKKSARTKDGREADELAKRVDRRLRMIEQGDLVVPAGADVATFLLSDGRLTGKTEPPKTITLTQLFDEYHGRLPEGSLEANSLYTARIHVKHLVSFFGRGFRFYALAPQDLQRYVNARSRKKGLRGKPLSPTTIKKELATFSGAWSFAFEAGYVSHAFAESIFDRRGGEWGREPFPSRVPTDGQEATHSLLQQRQVL